MRFAITVLLLLLPVAVLAQDKAAVTASEADCRWLVKHVARNDVAYKPGVDVHGRKVAPADLNSSGSIEVPTEIPISLLIPLRNLPVPVAPSLLNRAEINAGTVTVDRISGKVLYNGAPVGDAGQSELAAACQQRLSAGQ